MGTTFTEQQSFSVINEMIDRARNNIQKGSAGSMIWHGYAVALVAVANFALVHLLPEAERNMSFMVWWLMIPSNIIGYFLKRKINRSKIVRTQIDSIISFIWQGFLISIFILLVMLLSLSAILDTWHYVAIITPVIMLMTAMAEFSMAKACRYKPFYWGAASLWAGTLLCTLSYVLLKAGDVQFLVLAACMITGFVIPGHILNKKAKQHV